MDALLVDLKCFVQQKPELAECVRELLRSLCLCCGIHPETQCLADLWILLTRAQVQINSGISADDVDQASMGIHQFHDKPFDLAASLATLNVYQKTIYKKEVSIAIAVLESLKPANAELLAKALLLLQSCDRFL